MNRCRFLAAGVSLASLALSGCQDAGKPSATAATRRVTATRTTRRASTSRRTTGAERASEDLWIRNEESTPKTVRLSVRRRSEQQAIVDAYYEVPGGIVLTFPDLLRHGTAYRFEVVPSQAEPSTKTLTPTGCGENSEVPAGEKPVVVDVTESEPSILFKACDVTLSGTTARADQYRVEKSAATVGHRANRRR